MPRALHTDWKNVYRPEPTAKEILHGTSPLTQFGRMCEGLGIKIIAAGSPEAKGLGRPPPLVRRARMFDAHA